MKRLFLRAAIFVLSILIAVGVSRMAEAQLHMAYISDAPSSSVPYWVAGEAGIFKKYGLDIDLIYINGSTRGIQSLMAGDLSFTGLEGIKDTLEIQAASDPKAAKAKANDFVNLRFVNELRRTGFIDKLYGR